VGCQREAAIPIGDADSASPTPAATLGDSIPEERPDTIPVASVDSATVLLSLLPAPAGGALTGEAASLAERAVFAPRTQRWFMARMVDSLPSMDVGRIDGGVGTTESARVALMQVLAERSPVTPGMSFILHARGGSRVATVTSLTTSGRRIIARLDVPAFAADERALPVEWRGAPAYHPHAVTRAECTAGDSAAIERTVAKYVPSKDSAVSVLRGCFGRFRALVTVRPTTITPESGERVILVKPDGKTQRGRLRDLSYPLHELVSVLDIDGDGTQEIVVHSFRPAMETWAALRMTDSVAFTRFSSGFTIEKR
jgi:hypothetical protein